MNSCCHSSFVSFSLSKKKFTITHRLWVVKIYWTSNALLCEGFTLHFLQNLTFTTISNGNIKKRNNNSRKNVDCVCVRSIAHSLICPFNRAHLTRHTKNTTEKANTIQTKKNYKDKKEIIGCQKKATEDENIVFMACKRSKWKNK